MLTFKAVSHQTTVHNSHCTERSFEWFLDTLYLPTYFVEIVSCLGTPILYICFPSVLDSEALMMLHRFGLSHIVWISLQRDTFVFELKLFFRSFYLCWWPQTSLCLVWPGNFSSLWEPHKILTSLSRFSELYCIVLIPYQYHLRQRKAVHTSSQKPRKRNYRTKQNSSRSL